MHPFTSVPTILVNTVGVAVTTVGAGFTPARSGARGSTQPAYLSEGDTRVCAISSVSHEAQTWNRSEPFQLAAVRAMRLHALCRAGK